MKKIGIDIEDWQHVFEYLTENEIAFKKMASSDYFSRYFVLMDDAAAHKIMERFAVSVFEATKKKP